MTRRSEIAKDLPRCGLRRDEAAAFIGVSGPTFEAMVGEGLMPAPKKFRKLKLWSLDALKTAFMALPEEENGADDDEWGDVAA